MKREKYNAIKVISLLIIISTFLFYILIPLQGCSPEKDADITTTETGIETRQADTAITEESIVESAEQEVTQGEDVAEAIDAITDNINLFSGLELSDGILDSRPLAIMVQNNPKARPHSGLIYADIVFEVVAEGGVTRFVTVFSSHDADIIGPVRSGRIYFAEIARSLDPVYTFWGTYPEAYEAIKNMDMDALDANSTAYINYTSAGWRDSSRNEALEHTAFIDTYGIKEDAAEFGYSLDGGQSPLKFKIDAFQDQRGDISEIIVDFSSTPYLAGFDYDKTTNEYLKSVGGQPHRDFETGEQISLNNVIVLITDIDGPVDSAGHMIVRTTGTHEQGMAFYFMDGKIIEGTWARLNISDPFEFKDADGNQALFNRGSTWICIIQSEDRLSY